MTKSTERYYEAIDYGKKQKAKLTKKQYLVYSYLMSMSKWNAQRREDHYYVYKNTFLIKDACKMLGISQPTWRNAIQKLQELFYITEFDAYYQIEIPNTYAPLDIYLIKYLLQYGTEIQNGGHIVSVYSVLYRYWYYCTKNGDSCEISISQLLNLFDSRNGKTNAITYRLMLSLFDSSELIKMAKVGREYQGEPYTAYLIKEVKLALTNEEKKRLETLGNGDIKEILKALGEKDVK